MISYIQCLVILKEAAAQEEEDNNNEQARKLGSHVQFGDAIQVH